MAKMPASVQLTGGAGFEFEDQVAAYFAVAMLAGTQPLGAGVGGVCQLDWQTRDSGWLLDDLLVSLARPAKARLALSIKSDRQVTGSGFPASFVTALWEQRLGKGTSHSDFSAAADLLGLVVGEIGEKVREDWDELLRQSLQLGSNPQRLVNRYTSENFSSAGGRAIFASLRCPPSLDTASTDQDLASLLSCVRLIHLDFTSPTSRDRAGAVHVLQRVLASGDAMEAASLWESICRVCTGRRTAGGSLSRAELLAELRERFQLKDAPDHEAAWARLQQLSTEYASRVKQHIGPDVRLHRQDLISQLKTQILDNSAVLISGSSGSGKSAITRAVVEDTGFCSRFLWLDADTLADATPTELQGRLGAAIPLATLFAETTPSLSVLVLDGLDRFNAKALVTVASLLNSLSKPLGSSGWAVLATTRAESTVELSSRLRQVGVGELFAGFTLQPPVTADIRAALVRLPKLRHLATQPTVVNALRNLKVFDWVASAAQGSDHKAPDSWVGVMDVLSWVWDSWIGTNAGRVNRATALKLLGGIEAESLSSGVGLLSVQQIDGAVVEELQRLDLIREDVERLFFTHDLIGDLARLRVLLDVGSDTAQRIQKVLHPRWHAAVRLLGQHLAERSRAGNREWKLAFDAVDDILSEGKLYRNLLIEGVCLASNAEQLIDLLWPDLIADDGSLLRRLLDAFCFIATTPDPRIRSISANPESQATLEANVRVPYWPYWLPMLTALSRHVSDLCPLAPTETGRVLDLWLRSMPVGTLCRKEAATIALALAKEIQASRGEHFRAKDNEEEAIFRALLNSAPELPDEVAQVCLELAQRRPEPTEVIKRRLRFEETERKRIAEWTAKHTPKKLLGSLPVFGDGVMTKPNPDGPTASVDRGLQRAVLGGTAITTLASVRPDAAREVLLACAIEPPHRVMFGRPDPLESYGIASLSLSEPPFYSRGPWLALLEAEPALAIGAILRIVNHATEYWAGENQKIPPDSTDEGIKPAKKSVRVLVDGIEREWIGDSRVFGWYRHHLIGSVTIVSALMAVEKFLYDELDAGHAVDTIVQQIWNESSSVAMLGVLTAVFSRHPELLEGPLSPLLGVWHLHDWNYRLFMNDRVWMLQQYQWVPYGEAQFDVFVKWNTLPHRKRELLHQVVGALLTKSKVRASFEDIRRRWAVDAEREPDSAADIRRLSAKLDPKNYTVAEQNDKTILVSFNWPHDLKEETTRQGAHAQTSLAFLSFPHRCRQLLDKDEPLSDAAAEALWNELRDLSTFQLESERDEPFGPVRQREDVVAAGVTVLVMLASEWLEGNEGHARWCADEIVSIWHNPPAPPRFDCPESVTTDAWHCFLAELAVFYLAQDSNSVQTRAWAAAAVMSRWHASTRLAMERAFRLRDTLGEDFPRLANLAVMYAGLLGARHHFFETDAELERFEVRCDRLVGAFIRRTIPAKRLNWSEVGRICRESHLRLDRKRFPGKYEKEIGETDASGDSPRESSIEERIHQTLATRKRTPRVHPGYDLHVLTAGFAWLPNALGNAGADQALALVFVEDLLEVFLSMLATDDDDDDLHGDEQMEGTPYSFDTWVFDLVARAVPSLDGEPAARLWRPILNLGPRAHYWIESFCNHWHVDGLKSSPSREAFFARWSEMIAFAETSPVWNPTPKDAHHRLYGLWQGLLGMGIGVQVAGAKENEPFLARMVPIYERWAKRWLQNSISVRAFCVLLLQAGAKPLRVAAIPWLASAAQALAKSRRDRDDIDDLLIRVLRLVWRDSSDQLAADAALKRYFIDLVTLLAAAQNADALHLRDTVASAIGKSDAN